MSDYEVDCDIAVVGYGPVGEYLAITLGRLGYRVEVFERWLEPYDLPRAVVFDDEIARLFASYGFLDEVLAITDPVPDFYEWRNRNGDVLLKIDWSQRTQQGYPSANFYTQPDLQRVLDKHARAEDTVRINMGTEVRDIVDRGDHVSFAAVAAKASTSRDDSEPGWAGRNFTARYLIGADGANSATRAATATVFHDLNRVPFDWLILDVKPFDDAREWSPMNWQLCDPARPTTIVSGGPGRRRWEIMRLPGETLEELNTEEAAWRLLEPWGITHKTAELERHAVYRFMASYAEDWRKGHILLTGDAAHLMPPFAGQGLCNGLRDVSNLVWKLNLVMQGKAPDALLETYQEERRDHVCQWIDFSAALGEIICVLDEDEARVRDARMIAGEGDPARVMPSAPPTRFKSGLFIQQQQVAGTLSIHGEVGYRGKQGRLAGRSL
jgi:2-polyprenyl-6-methoxyphenol hydroxylase-like FAD-dependent oxidoreductase